ncbi:hypothetical protein INT46_008891 [Mucor plumbeus]|uniref:BAG domain-containing protein n=1 Tax=Mucor plumbeus TaxID=97098 RepID=A0A8H7QHU2_9FUNG|nr:hypothetical protein INT46_008891 [Mucor plumbeus]
MFYFQQQQQYQRRPQLSVGDYVQLQLLLRQEQAQREQAVLYKKQQEEQRRLEKALYNLEVITELQRRREQEELAIEAYYAAKKRRQQQEEALLRHRRQQEEAYYNAILEQRKQQQIEQQNYLRVLALQHQQQQQQQQQAIKSAEYANPCHILAAATIEQDVSDSESEADQELEVAKQLESLVRLIFGQQDVQEQEQEQEQEQHEPVIDEQQQQEQETDTREEQTVSLDDFAHYISKKAQELDDIDNDDDAMEEDEQDLAVSATQHIDDHEEDESEDSVMEEDEVPALINSTESLHHLVNDILTNTTTNDEPFSNFPEEDPVKIAKFEALSRIEQELDEIRQQHEDHILHVALDFSPDGRSASPDTISASTAENREFLGYEDQIVKILLKLDMIESDGDEHIRNERKALVKRAEAMLEKLDEYKQKEWERVSCSSHSDNEEIEEEYIAVL